MLFVNDRLISKYDFENAVSNDNANYNSLVAELDTKLSIIGELLSEKKPVILAHKDNDGIEIRINSPYKKSASAEKVTALPWERERQEILQMIHRKQDDGNHTTFETKLSQVGIGKPKDDSSDYPAYFQLLYFFYMMRYVIFPEEDFFNLMNERHLSSDQSPIERAANGRYWFFVMENLLDRPECQKWVEQVDDTVTSMIWSIGFLTDAFISQENDPSTNINRSKELNNLLDGVKSKREGYYQNKEYSLLVQTMFLGYRYQNLSYSHDMIKNLDPSLSPFIFSEPEIPLREEWGNKYLTLSDIDNFLKELEVIQFCKQRIEISGRLDKIILGTRVVEYLSEILQYDRNIANTYGNGLFTETEEDGETVILAEYLALLVKTYFDLDTVSMEMLFHNTSKKWKDSQSLHRVLGNVPNDLSLRLFVVAFHSEYLSNNVDSDVIDPLAR